VNKRSIQAGRKYLLDARAKIDIAIRCVELVLAPTENKKLGITKSEDQVFLEIDDATQRAIDLMYDAQNKFELPK